MLVGIGTYPGYIGSHRSDARVDKPNCNGGPASNSIVAEVAVTLWYPSNEQVTDAVTWVIGYANESKVTSMLKLLLAATPLAVRLIHTAAQ